jgi:tripartite-type tricarboxylate transporter receptor subunit TctC
MLVKRGGQIQNRLDMISLPGAPMKLFRSIAGALALATFSVAVAAQDLPPQLRLVVGYAAGGSSDTIARMLADHLKDDLRTTVIVDNRPGAGGQIAAEYVRQQPADGGTLLFANSHMMVMLPLTSRAPRYSAAQFKPIGRVTTFYEAIAVPSSSTATTVTQWLDGARKDAKLASFGIPAAGSVSHFLGYRLGLDAKVDLLPVPYKGAAPLVSDLLGGQIAAGIVPVLDVAAHSATGKLKVIAVNGPKRTALLPNVPTLKELGVAGFDDLEWTALLAPSATPNGIVQRVNASVNKALATPEFKQRLAQLGMEPAPGSPDDLGRAIAADLAQWTPVVKASGFTAE